VKRERTVVDGALVQPALTPEDAPPTK